MGRRPDGRVEPGQSIETAFSARAWNRAQDAADIVLNTLGGVQGQAVPPGPLPYTWVMLKNTGGGTIERHAAVNISDSQIAVDPSDDDNALFQFDRLPVLHGSAAAPGLGYLNAPNNNQFTFNLPTFGIAVEPIDSNAIGRVAIAGAVQAKCTVVSHLHQYVTFSDSGKEDALMTAPVGEAKIIWRGGGASFSGSKSGQWALIHLGVGHHTTEIDYSISAGVSWSKDTYKTVTAFPNETLQVFNGWQTISGNVPGRQGLVTFARNRWNLVATNLWYEPYDWSDI